MSEEAYNSEAIIESQISYIAFTYAEEVGDTSVLLLAPDELRRGVILSNPYSDCFVTLDVVSSPNLYTYRMTKGCTVELENYRGCISAIRNTSQTGQLLVTEKKIRKN